ncbi:MAG TPA: TerB family tellurite resistance protein [Longimicrobiales bacterium]|nr:TerB family tellurite resistance protein [Longimicrobiales bacterium]
MREAIRKFFDDHMRAPADGGDTSSEPAPRPANDADRRVQVAACALLIELAYADDEFSPAERMHLEAVVRRHFGLDVETAGKLLALAAEKQAAAIDLYQFTSLIRDSYDLGQKTLLAEIMWGLIMADGKIAAREAYLLRKIANLLDLKPGYLSVARNRVENDD